MMRMPETSSCNMALIPSRWPCRRVNSGLAFSRHSAMQPTMTGKAHSTTRPKRGFRRNMKKMLPNISMPVRIIPRMKVEM